MVGKLIGVSLVAVTQLGIWTLAFIVLSVYGVGALAARGYDDVAIPHLPFSFFVYFFLFFVAGYFIYASIYVLIGSMVTTAPGGRATGNAMVFVLVAGLYLGFPVIRSPNSSFAFWVFDVPALLSDYNGGADRIADPACLADYSLAVTGGRNRLFLILAGISDSTGSVC